MNEALLAVARGADATTIESALVAAREETEKRADTADDALAASKYGELGLIDAFRGRKEDAIRDGRRAVELKEDPLEKNDAAANLALIYARTGEPDEAIKLIEKLLTLPASLQYMWHSSMTQADLNGAGCGTRSGTIHASRKFWKIRNRRPCTSARKWPATSSRNLRWKSRMSCSSTSLAIRNC